MRKKFYFALLMLTPIIIFSQDNTDLPNVLFIAQIIGAAGLGAVLTKILDIFWLQKQLQNNDHKKWLREQRYKAFTNLSKHLISFGLHKKDKSFYDPFKALALSTETLLLIKDEELAKKINELIIKLDEFHVLNQNDDDESQKAATNLYKEVYSKSQILIKELRNYLVDT